MRDQPRFPPKTNLPGATGNDDGLPEWIQRLGPWETPREYAERMRALEHAEHTTPRMASASEIVGGDES